MAELIIKGTPKEIATTTSLLGIGVVNSIEIDDDFDESEYDYEGCGCDRCECGCDSCNDTGKGNNEVTFTDLTQSQLNALMSTYGEIANLK